MTRLWAIPSELRDGSVPTPGPWIAIQGIDDDTTRWGIYTEALPIATIENGANARLIAAAPDLLHALKVMLQEKIDYMRINNLGNAELTGSVVLARAALAKAEGMPV